MKRRRFIQAVTTASAAPALIVQGVSAQQRTGTAAVKAPEIPRLEVTSPDAAGETLARFFNALQFAALRRLGEVLQPAQNGVPGAIEAGAPEFLDFLIGASPAVRQKVYRAGLDALNAVSRQKCGKDFGDADAAQADSILRPLLVVWLHDPPEDPLVHFICEVHQDLRTATMNSREWAEAAASSASRRRAGNTGIYFHPVE